jgi:short-subunit dehydrogenase
MNLVIRDEIIWVTGASSGIGSALAIKLAEQGNKVFVSARNEQSLKALAAQYSNIIPIVFDITNESARASVTEHLESHTDYLDRIVINAGTCEYFDINQPDWSMMPRIMDVNFNGAINTLAIAMPLLKRKAETKTDNARPHIIGIGSLATVLPFNQAEAYGASKAALQYFYDALRLDLINQAIDVTVINPGFVKTPLTDKNHFPMPFLMAVDVAAERMVRAIAKRKRQYDFPFRLNCLMRLLSLSPSLWRWVLSRQ